MSQRTLRSTAAARHHGVARRPRRLHDRARHARGHDRAPGPLGPAPRWAGRSRVDRQPVQAGLRLLPVTGAALGDRFGRRRTLGTGLARSTAASAACALSSGVETSETGVLAGDANGPTEREYSARACARLVAGLISSAASKQERRRGLGASADNAHERAADLRSPAPRYFASPRPKSRVARQAGPSQTPARAA
jgi:hypothetical protein